jgi:DnaK suppressor protein
MGLLSLPKELFFGKLAIDTNVLFLVLGVVFWLFLLWYETRRDGFDDMRVFDLGFMSLFLGFSSFVALNYLYNYLMIFFPTHAITGLLSTSLIYVSAFIISLLPVIFGVKKLRWSVYRILDIYSIAFTGLLLFLSLSVYLVWGFDYLIYSFFGTIAFLTIAPKIRVRRFFSGAVFVVFTALLAVLNIFAFETDLKRFTSGAILAIISLITLYFVLRKSMVLRKIADEILKKLRENLITKKKDLKVEQELLIQEDPYLREGRDTDNAEIVEEAINEDAKKIEIDQQMDDIKESEKSIDESLTDMKTGNYGICKNCGNPIDVARLQALPDAKLCIDCAEKAEEL